MTDAQMADLTAGNYVNLHTDANRRQIRANSA
jgi:hypothetical protein